MAEGREEADLGDRADPVQAQQPAGMENVQQPARDGGPPANNDGQAQQPGPPQQPAGNAAGVDLLARLTNVLERMGGGQPLRPGFKAPKFDGSGDVEYFIDQFTEVAVGNAWDQGSTLIHLRESLKGNARDCGRSATLNGVLQRLRERYGVTPREARSRLATMHRSHKTSLQEHADEVSRLMYIEYAELEDRQHRLLAVEIFTNSLHNPALQRHLLAVDPRDLPSAVKAGDEFLSIKPSGTSGSGVRQVEERETIEHAQTLSTKEQTTLDGLSQMVQELTKQVEKLQKNQASTRPTSKGGRRPPNKENSAVCWGCQQGGHIRKDCPTHPWPASNQKQPKVGQQQTNQGNENSPQQQ